MTQETIRRPAPRTSSTGSSATRTGLARLAAVLVLIVAIAVILFLVLRNSGTSSTQGQAATLVSPAKLTSLAATVGHPIFWLGPKQGDRYELTRLGNGTIYLRYLPKGAAVGTATSYLTVATYPFAGAYEALQTVAKQSGSTQINIAHDGLAVVSSSAPKNVHIAYPGVDYQVEVFDPTAGSATSIVASGQVKAIGSLASSTTSAATATTAAGLKAAAKTAGHPIYWLGAKKGLTYELTEPSNGAIYVRYLPTSAKVGTTTPYLTVATYPFAGAFSALKALAKQQGAKPIKLTGGGLALVDSQDKNSIHLAYPGVNFQIEVFDPSAATTRQLVASDQVSSIGG